MHSRILSLLTLAILLGLALARTEAVGPASSSVKLQIFGSSSIWWIAVQPQNDGGVTTKVEVKDQNSNFVAMQPNPGWGYYTLTSTSGMLLTSSLSIAL